MDPLVAGTFQDSVLTKLPLRDIRALKSTSSQYANMPVNLVITLEIDDIGDDEDISTTVFNAELESGDLTKIITKYNIEYILRDNFDLTKYVIKPKYDLLEYISRHRVYIDENFETVININSDGPLSTSLEIKEDTVSDSIELPFPVWRHYRTVYRADDIIYIYKLYNIKKLKERYKINKQQFASLYSDIVYKMIMNEPVYKSFLFVSKKHDNVYLHYFYRDNQIYSVNEGIDILVNPEELHNYIIKNIDKYNIYDFDEFTYF